MSALDFLRRHVPGITVATVALCLFGALSLRTLPSGLYPEVAFPRIVVAASLPSASAQTLQLSVTRPVEEGLTTLPGVRRVRSRTIRGAAELSLWFEPGTDMDRALGLVNARLAELRGDLPPGTDLVAERLLPSSFPIQTVAVSGSAPPSVLRDVALYTLRPRLAGLPGVGRVEVLGGDVREVEVIVDPARMESTKLELARVATALSDALRQEPVGRVDVRYLENLLVVSGPVEELAAMAEVVVGGTPDSPVRLGDIARVEEGHADRLSLTSSDGRPAALVNVGRRPGADAVALATAVQAELAALAPSLPPGVTMRMAYDQAALISRAVANVRDAVALGGLLTLVVVGLFLRSWKATLAAAAALPATLLMTFAAMRLAHEGMNLMSLGGLAVAIGLVVDDAVVVVEAVFRRVAAGMERWTATAEALREIALPVTNSTLTTVVVFAPLSLLSGVSGQFFSALAFTLCVAVLLSLAVALTLTPLLCGWLLRPRGSPHPAPAHPRYLRVLLGTLRSPALTLGAAALATLALFFVARGVGTGFLPELDEGAFVVDYFTPTGTALSEADRLSRTVEETVRGLPEVEVTSRRLGAELGPPTATQPFTGDITVKLRERRSRTSQEIISEARARVEAIAPGVRVEFIELLQDILSDLEGNPDPVEIKLQGMDLEALRAFAPQVAERLQDIPGLADLYAGVEGCVPELHLDVRPELLGRLGLTTRDVSDQLRTALFGQIVASVPRAGRLLDVRVHWSDAARFDPQVLGRLRLRTPSGEAVPLESVARLERVCLPSELLSDNLRPLVAVTGRLEGRDLGGVTADVEARLKALTPPPGVEMRLGGQRDSQREAFLALVRVLMLATFGVLLVLTFHFRSLLLPLLILAVAPIALVAGVGVLRLVGEPLNVSSFMGCILLVGLVVKNGILLIDHAQAARAEGLDAFTAIERAALVRVRPILMTTLATLLGLVPLALGLGTGAELQRPLALAVLGGLSLSTLAVLLVLPAAYVLLTRHAPAPGDAG
ncbi:efflux RND transporter permease subunit [Archangium violaceum]|uniref:efflux RND transporter permease subunit n=1 Tax=Archangium violaceum TaxID=83451 RepID=UPI0036D873A6